MPLFHSYAMAMGLYLSGYSASTLVILPGYQPERLLEAMEQHEITIFPGSPTIFAGLMNCERFSTTRWSRVHTCYSGSAALPEETLQRWEAATGSRVFEGYGQTESGPVLSFNPSTGATRIGSVGVPVPGTGIEIVDVETGTRVLPIGERGEIRARGPQIMSGYLNLEQETRESLREGWLYTGDIGELDADGYLYIRDRKKDLVIVGGYNVYPREVEEVLYTHPAVLEAAVVGQPDAYRGEVLRAYVALRPDASPVSHDELQAHCSRNLAKYKVPAVFEVLPALPKTSVNKIDKKPLKLRAVKASAR
jgi:long-chain acyl-CoA synthetase